MISSLVMASSLLLGGLSYHLTNDEYDYNSNHQVVGLEYNGIGFGHYKNSFYQNAFFGYKYFDVYNNFGVKVGLMGGYKDYNMPLDIYDTGYVLAIMPTYRSEYADFTVSLMQEGLLFTATGRIDLWDE